VKSSACDAATLHRMISIMSPSGAPSAMFSRPSVVAKKQVSRKTIAIWRSDKVLLNLAKDSRVEASDRAVGDS